MSGRHTGIAVLEGKWWRGWNSSVRSTFDMIAEMACDDAHAYHYEMANSLPALDEAVPRIAADRKCKYLCIATHGGEKALELFNGETVSTRHLRKLLEELPSGSRFAGLYLAACSTANARMAASLLEGDTKLDWLAGYGREVDWLRSTILDMLFFNELICASDQGEPKPIRRVAERLRLLAPGLLKELGFSIFVIKRGEIENLLGDAA